MVPGHRSGRLVGGGRIGEVHEVGRDSDLGVGADQVGLDGGKALGITVEQHEVAVPGGEPLGQSARTTRWR